MLSLSKATLIKAVKNTLIFLMITSGSLSIAALQPIQDEELSSYSGQAAIQVDRLNDSSQKLDFTRIKFGLDVKTNLTIDTLNLGDYDRDGNTKSDIFIDNFALGSINPDGTIEPFQIRDPFIDLARDSDTGEVVGLKVGFGSSKGALSGNIDIVSGEINVDIRDTSNNLFNTILTANPIAVAPPSNPLDIPRYIAELVGSAVGTGADGLLAGATQLLATSGNPVTGEVSLVNDSGQIINTRAERIGLPTGTALQIHDVNSVVAGLIGVLDFPELVGLPGIPRILGIDCVASGLNTCSRLDIISGGQMAGIPGLNNPCHVLTSTPVCFDLGKYQTINLGKKNADGSYDFYDGNFLALSGKEINWPGKVANGQAENWQYANKGYFFNIADGSLQLDLIEATGGTERLRTRYIDPYY